MTWCPGQLLAPLARTEDEVSEVHEELQIQVGQLRAGGAVAADGVLDAAQASPEGEVALLDHVQEHRPVQIALERIAECGIALELVHADDPLEAVHHGRGHVGHHILGVLERTRDDVVRVARDVGDEEAAAGSHGEHEPKCTPCHERRKAGRP